MCILTEKELLSFYHLVYFYSFSFLPKFEIILISFSLGDFPCIGLVDSNFYSFFQLCSVSIVFHYYSCCTCISCLLPLFHITYSTSQRCTCNISRFYLYLMTRKRLSDCNIICGNAIVVLEIYRSYVVCYYHMSHWCVVSSISLEKKHGTILNWQEIFISNG